MPGANWLIFWRETLHVNTFGLTEAIFEFYLKSRDMTQKSKIFEPRLDPLKNHQMGPYLSFQDEIQKSPR